WPDRCGNRRDWEALTHAAFDGTRGMAGQRDRSSRQRKDTAPVVSRIIRPAAFLDALGNIRILPREQRNGEAGQARRGLVWGGERNQYAGFVTCGALSTDRLGIGGVMHLDDVAKFRKHPGKSAQQEEIAVVGRSK